MLTQNIWDFLRKRMHSRCVMLGLLAFHTGLLAWGALVHSPTLNEPGHLVAGVSYWQFGRFDVYRVNPPLVRLVAALPVVLAEPATDWRSFYVGAGSRPEFELGRDFVAANGDRAFRYMTLARWACIPLSLLGGYICYRWAGTLYGERAAILALTLWTISPNILAHGQLITCDAAATSLGLAACYTFWLWLKRPTWRHTLISGFVLGFAELAKTTLLVLYPLWPFMWLVYRWRDRQMLTRHDWFREIAMLVARVLIGLYVINLGYAFEGTGTPLRDYRFVSKALTTLEDNGHMSNHGGNRFADSWLGRVPVPLPKNYVLGIDMQKRDFEDYGQPSYLREHFQERGWWYYYLYGLVVKVPLGTWLLFAMAAIGRLRGGTRASFRDEFIVLCPAAVIFAFVSSQIGFSQHLRYVLPVFPLTFVWIGSVAKVFETKRQVAKCLVVGATTWSVASSLWVYPHSLSYFNELAGGPESGRRHLIHSNIDWGQDLFYLKAWLDQHPEAKPLKLAYFGGFDPRHAGIEYSAPLATALQNDGASHTATSAPGWYAISVNVLQGFPCSIDSGDGARVSLPRNALVAFQNLEPVAMAGYSIYIYHIPGNDGPRKH